MRLAFVLFKYFPYGGLQRDFMRIAMACQAQGHDVRVYCLHWQGDLPAGIPVDIADIRAFSHHRRNEKFSVWLRQKLASQPCDLVVGFNKMAGLDVYYAADPCFEEKVRTLRPAIYRLTPRYRHFYREERAVFGTEHNTHVLMISETQKPFFVKHYGTPEHRFHLLPPGIARDRQRPAHAEALRATTRATLGISDAQTLCLSVGSGFKTKGLDRSIRAIAALPTDDRERVRLLVVGQDNARTFQAQATALGVSEQVVFLGGRDDVPALLVAADVLLHPAYNENTGTVLLEALVSGLPVITTDVCGYAHFIEDAQAGIVLHTPFDAAEYVTALQSIMKATTEQRSVWQTNALRFANTADIYSMPTRAAEIISERARVRSVSP